jgi:hypothetical protein
MGDPALVWEMPKIKAPAVGKVARYTVTVSGMARLDQQATPQGGSTRVAIPDVTYSVTVFTVPEGKSAAAGRPRIESMTVGRATVRIVLDRPAASSGITSLEVRYRVKGTRAWTQKKFPRNTKAVRVSGLAKGAQVEAQVRARVRGGAGAWSAKAVSERVR